MGFAGEELDSLYRSALLHDIGKIAVPDAILNKPSRLTDEEFDIMKQHTVWGRKILEGLEFLPQADCGANLLTISKNREVLEMNIGSAPQTRYYNIGVKATF
jgi:hypothetical protein